MPFFQSFRAVRWIRTFNLVLQAVLFLTFFAGLNYVAKNHPSRFDLTQFRRYTLSAETASYLKNLRQTVHVYATVSDETQMRVEVRGLLDEFVHATETNPQAHITREYVNIYRDRRQAEELGLEQPGLLLLTCGDHRRVVPVSDLYKMKDEQGKVIPEAFRGEQVLTGALLEVSNPERQHVYFLVGHGELHPDDTDPARGLSALASQLKLRNFSVGTLDLSTNARIPDNASVLVAIWPQSSYSRKEQEMLRQYLSVSAGRLILALAPGISTARLGLDDLLLDWGVLVYDDVIVESDAAYHTTEGDLIIAAFDPDHPITEMFPQYRLALQFGYTRTVSPDPSSTPGSGLQVTTLAATSTTAWGDVGYRIGLPPNFSNEGNTHPLPGMKPPDRLGVIVASERVAARDLPFSVRAGRLVVIGSGDFVANQRIGTAGNAAVFLNAVNWAVERDRQFNVPARPIERFQLAMSAADLNRLNYALWFALPGAMGLLGLVVYWTRRK